MQKLTDKNILVTGGAGFNGSHLVDRLIQESPSSLTVVDSLFLGKEENLEEARRNFPVTFYKQDASDYDVMQQIICDESIDVVFNLAVIPLPASLERPRWTINVNVGMTTVLCDLLREGYYKTLIQFSSSEVYGTAQYVPMDEAHPFTPSTPYATSKLACDYVVLSYWRTFGIDAAIVRPFNNFGPRQNDRAYAGIIPIVIQSVLQNRIIEIFGDGEQTRDFIFVKDTVDAVLKTYENSATRGQVINLASGYEISVNQLVEKVLSIMGATDVPIIQSTPRPGDVRRHLGNIQLAQTLFGFCPTNSIDIGLQKTVQWYLEKNS